MSTSEKYWENRGKNVRKEKSSCFLEVMLVKIGLPQPGKDQNKKLGYLKKK